VFSGCALAAARSTLQPDGSIVHVGDGTVKLREANDVTMNVSVASMVA